MVSKFMSLDEEKRKKIINAAMKEFANKGYDRASTNEIVKEADISKGLLFHYFKNKKQLFLFLYDYAIESSIKEFYERLDIDEEDFFVKLRNVQQAKLDFLGKHPELMRFMEQAYMEPAEEVRGELDKRNMVVLQNNQSKVFEKVDLTKFKEGIDLKRVLSIVTWTVEGMANDALKKAKLLNKPVDYEELFEQLDIYYEILKQSFYK